MHMIPCWKDISEEYDRKHEFIKFIGIRFPEKCCLGPQNGSESLGPEKLLKIVNFATIKETKKPKETMVGVQVELVSGHL